MALPVLFRCLLVSLSSTRDASAGVRQQTASSALWRQRMHAVLTACRAHAPPPPKCCVLQEYNDKVGVMLTTASLEAFHMLRSSLPKRVR